MLVVPMIVLLLRRRQFILAFLVGAAACLWYGMARPQPTEINPGMRAGTQQDRQSGVFHPDFRGEWKLDRDASDSVAPLLRAAGKSEWTIALASQVVVTHIIRGDPSRLMLRIQMPVGTQEHEIPLDGAPIWMTGPDGNETLASTCWSDDGQALITTTQPNSRQSMTYRITRSLGADRRTMFLDVECRGKDGPPVRVHRVFRLAALL